MRGAEIVESLALDLTAEQMEAFYEGIGAALSPRRATSPAPAAEGRVVTAPRRTAADRIRRPALPTRLKPPSCKASPSAG
ncbi:hypothetical protein [Streptomyces sp. NPDC001657]|uniref:hypothetical protein n=1 Tax=Streptomyces sp. NPDC001657 TaxID=3154522 RepID=UPI0033238C31